MTELALPIPSWRTGAPVARWLALFLFLAGDRAAGLLPEREPRDRVGHGEFRRDLPGEGLRRGRKTREADGSAAGRVRTKSANTRRGEDFLVLGLFKGLRAAKFSSSSFAPSPWPTTISRAGSALRLERGERRPSVAPE